MSTLESIFIDVVILNTKVISSHSCDKGLLKGFFWIAICCDFVEKPPENTFTAKTYSRICNMFGSFVPPEWQNSSENAIRHHCKAIYFSI